MWKLLIFFIAILLSSLFLSSTAFAIDYHFIDDFNENRPNNSLDPDKWEVYPHSINNFDTIKEQNGTVTMKQQFGMPQFPLAIAKNPIPEGDFQLKVKYTFNDTSHFGPNPTSIITLNDSAIQDNNSNNFLIKVIMHPAGNGHLKIFFNNQEVKDIIPSYQTNLLTIKHIGNIYKIFLNQDIVYQSPSTDRNAKYLALGNTDPISQSIIKWIPLSIDYIQVRKIDTSKVPVLFIPGIGGSELQTNSTIDWSENNGHGGIYTHKYAESEIVWLNKSAAADILHPEDDYFDVLRMKPNGVDSEADIGLTGNLVPEVYQTTIDYFIKNGYTLNKNFFTLAYDWRKDITTLATGGLRQTSIDQDILIMNKIQQILEQTGADQIDVIAHSMGGLLFRKFSYNYDDYHVRDYRTKLGSVLPIRKYIELGVPHLGSVDALRTLLYGKCLTQEKLEEFYDYTSLCFGIRPSETKDLSHNMASIFQLLPNRAYYDLYRDYLIPFYDGRDLDNNPSTGVKEETDMLPILNNLGYNLAFSTMTSSAQHRFSYYVPGENIIISGSGLPTLGQIKEDYKKTILGKRIPTVYQTMINGDGSVPLLSSSLSTSTNMNLSHFFSSDKLYYVKQKHNNLVSEDSVLDLVKNILNNNNQLPSGVSTKPYTFKGKFISSHSPIHIHAYDNLGNHTGTLPNGDYEINIPDSTFDILGEDEFIFLPEDGIYSIKLIATNVGSFDLNIDSYKEDKINKQILYQDIPITQNTKGEAIFDTTKNISPTLNIDQDGNGTIDKQYRPEVSGLPDDVIDTTPPQTILEINEKARKDWFKSSVVVTLKSQDDATGSGVLKTEYSLNNGQSFQNYTQPFTISFEGITKLKYRATDNAGNTETVKSKDIQIDKTAPEAKIYFDPTTKVLVAAGIDQNPTTVKIKLKINPANPADCAYIIEDIAGNTLQITLLDQVGIGSRNPAISSFKTDSLVYNNDPTIKFVLNKFTNIYPSGRPTIYQEQNYSINNDIKIRIKYDHLFKKSTIYTKETGVEKIKEVRKGLVLLNLLTNKGKLEYSY